MLIPILMVGAIVVAIGVLLMIPQFRNGQIPERDTSMSRSAVKHPVRSNPGLIMYVLFPVLIVVGAIIWNYYY